MYSTVIGQRMRLPSSRLPMPMVNEAARDAVAMSVPQ